VKERDNHFMNTKTFFLRFAGLIALALSALPLFAITLNLLLFFHLIPDTLIDNGYGNALAQTCVYIWLVCLLMGFISIFVQKPWRLVLYFSPLYAPILFTIVSTAWQSATL
jgi:hypothetical protein